MPSNPCPACGQPIAMDDLNMAQGVGLCRACGKLSKLADIADQVDVDVATVADPPAGCGYTPPFGGSGTVVTASLRSPGTAIGLLAMALFWNGIVSIFVMFAIAGLYTHLIGPIPSWFPAPSVRRKNGNDSGLESLGGTLFLCLFLMPFVAIGTAMICGVFVSLMGRIEVTIHDTIGRVRTGVGPINWTKRFDPTRVKRVSVGKTSYQVNDKSQETIKIESDDQTINFASTLPDYRRKWLSGVLHLLLVGPGKDERQRLGLTAAVRN